MMENYHFRGHMKAQRGINLMRSKALDKFINLIRTEGNMEYAEYEQDKNEYFDRKKKAEAAKEVTGIKHGHPDFYKLLEEISGLHSRKNHDYATGGDPLGNFKRVAAFFEMYPNLDLADPTVVAIVYSMKQLDAALWMMSNGHTAICEGIEPRLIDDAVYKLIAVVLEREKKKEEAGSIPEEDHPTVPRKAVQPRIG